MAVSRTHLLSSPNVKSKNDAILHSFEGSYLYSAIGERGRNEELLHCRHHKSRKKLI